jgi:hypothetical protein
VTVEDRLRATTDALSGTMRQVRPLTLPPEQPGRVAPPREPRRGRGWLIPLTAAVAVIAVAITLVAVRDNRGASQAPTAPTANAAVASAPRYYVQLGSWNPEIGFRDAIVGDSRTGKVLATVKTPAHCEFAGVTGAADDRTFVIDATSTTKPATPNQAAQLTHTWYRLRIAPGTRHPAELTKLPIAAPANSAGVVGLALSPDAGTLAVLYQPGQDSLAGDSAQGAGGPFTLRTVSLATGKALRTWTAPEENTSAVVPDSGDDEAGLTWTANGQTLAFMLPPGAWPDYERTLNVSAKGTNLLNDSRAVLAIPNPGKQDNCLSLLLASDGRTMVCGTETTARGCQQEPQFNLYSAATGKLTRVLYRYQGSCWSGEADVLWAGAGGTAIGLIEAQRIVKNRATVNHEFGVVTAGKITPLHVLMSTDYFVAGTLAF